MSSCIKCPTDCTYTAIHHVSLDNAEGHLTPLGLPEEYGISGGLFADVGSIWGLDNTTAYTAAGEAYEIDDGMKVRASVGARLNELDTLDTVGGNRSLNYEQTLSDLVDLDYARAISDYTLRQVGLQASQKAFVDIQGMSLFDQL